MYRTGEYRDSSNQDLVLYRSQEELWVIIQVQPEGSGSLPGLMIDLSFYIVE